MKNRVRNRIFLVLAFLFFSTMAFYLLVYTVYEPLAAGVAVAWGTSALFLVIVLERRRPGVLGLEHEYRELFAFINLQPLLGDAFLPYTSSALEPGSMLHLLSTIQANRYHTIIECGSGASTILIGKLLRQMGEGQLYVLEENEQWYDLISAVINHHGLSTTVNLFYAPLEPNPHSGELWYAPDAVRQILDQVGRADLLLVDGPTSLTPLSRFPALPAFAPVLDTHSLIVLDDSKRDYERGVIKRWREMFDLQVEEYGPSLRGLTLIRL
jgi:hypothetical protein